MSEIKFLIICFLLWRIFLFVPVLLTENLPLRQGYLADELFLGNDFLTQKITPFANFDGVHYLNIAQRGYVDEGRFFPLFPLLIKAFSLISNNSLIAGFLLANSFFMTALYIFYKLLRLDFTISESRWVVLGLLLFPTSFFFGSIYSESLFLLLSVSAFYTIRQQKWFYSGILGSLLTATRVVGVLILPALFFEITSTSKSLKDVIKKSLPLLLIPVTLLMYSLFNYQKWGELLYFVKAHSLLENGRSSDSLVFPLQTLYRYTKIFTSLSPSTYEWWIAFLEFSTFFGVILLLFIAWKKKVRMSYLIFSISIFLLPIFSGTFSGLPRYVLVMFPIFIAFALIRSNSIKVFCLILSGMLLFILTMFFTRGYYVA